MKRGSIAATFRSPRALLEKESPDIAAGIPERRKIIAFRNILIHGYAAVDDRIVWGVIENYLPPLKRAVDGLVFNP